MCGDSPFCPVFGDIAAEPLEQKPRGRLLLLGQLRGE
jgi:hypothetical protein